MSNMFPSQKHCRRGVVPRVLRMRAAAPPSPAPLVPALATAVPPAVAAVFGPAPTFSWPSDILPALPSFGPCWCADFCCFNNFWAKREKTKRALRVHWLRKARGIAGWSRFRGVVSRIVWRTRTHCAHARREKRISVVMADVVQLMTREAAALQRAQRERAVATRRARLNLLHAAVVRPVLTAMYVDAHPRGDG